MTRPFAAPLALVCLATAAPAQQWGAVKGQIVWTGSEIPKPKKIDVDVS